jgi:outer membrane protein assembly factor BamB
MNLRRRYWVIAASAMFSVAALSSCKDYSPDLPLPDKYTKTLFVSSNNQIVYAIDPISSEKKWKFSVDGEVHATPVLRGNHLWVGTTSGKLYQIDKQFGKEINQRTFGGPIIGTPYVYENRLLLVPAGNTLYALDVNDISTIVWSYNAGGTIETSPTAFRVKIDGVTSPAIFVADAGNNVAALNDGGGTLWTFTPPEAGAFYSSPCVVNDEYLYAGNDNGRMYAVNTNDGSLKWSFPTAGQVRSSPIHIGGNVLFGSNDRNFYSVDSASGMLRWKVATADAIQSSPAVFNQNVYFGSYDRNLYCVDIIDGTVKWKMLTSALIKSSPLLYNGEVYFGGYDKNLYRLDAMDGSQKYIFNVNGQMATSPIIDSVGGAAVPSISGNYRY